MIRRAKLASLIFVLFLCTFVSAHPALGENSTFNVGKNPEYMAIDSSGNVWVVNGADNTVTKIPAGATP